MLTCIKPDLEPERPEPAGGAGEAELREALNAVLRGVTRRSTGRPRDGELLHTAVTELVVLRAHLAEARRALAAAEAERERLAADLEACNSEANGLAAETTWNIDQRRAAEAERDAAREQAAALREAARAVVAALLRRDDAAVTETINALMAAVNSDDATEQGGA